MKPQCETTADCLEQLARVMREFGFTNMIDAISSEFIYYEGKQYNITDKSYIPHFDHPSAWSFAIAKLEDKPVFLGDELYCTLKGCRSCEKKGSKKVIVTEYTGFNHLSWTPPKQTISIKVGDNEPVEIDKALAIRNHTESAWVVVECETYEAAEQFCKAMKPLVKE